MVPNWIRQRLLPWKTSGDGATRAFLRDLRKGHDFPQWPPWQAAGKKKRISWRKNPNFGISERDPWISPCGEDPEPDHAGEPSFPLWTSSRPRPASFVGQSFLEV